MVFVCCLGCCCCCCLQSPVSPQGDQVQASAQESTSTGSSSYPTLPFGFGSHPSQHQRFESQSSSVRSSNTNHPTLAPLGSTTSGGAEAYHQHTGVLPGTTRQTSGSTIFSPSSFLPQSPSISMNKSLSASPPTTHATVVASGSNPSALSSPSSTLYQQPLPPMRSTTPAGLGPFPPMSSSSTAAATTPAPPPPSTPASHLPSTNTNGPTTISSPLASHHVHLAPTPSRTMLDSEPSTPRSRSKRGVATGRPSLPGPQQGRPPEPSSSNPNRPYGPPPSLRNTTSGSSGPSHALSTVIKETVSRPNHHHHSAAAAAAGEFRMERPEDSTVERMFEELIRKRDLFDGGNGQRNSNMMSMSIDHKWSLVYNDCLTEWTAARTQRLGTPPTLTPSSKSKNRTMMSNPTSRSSPD